MGVHFRTVMAALSALAALISAGCLAGHNYERPPISGMDTFRGAPADIPSTAASFGDQKWWDVFEDPQLQALIRTALQENYDVRIAARRILEAQAQLGITRAAEYPSAAGILNSNDYRYAQSKFFSAYETSNTELGIGFQWNLDFWGKYRRATEAARDQLLSDEWAQKEVVESLVAGLASAYFTLRDLDLQLQISERTLASNRDSLQLTQLLSDRGATSLLDVRQAEQLVYTAAAAVPSLEKQIQQQENLIRTLMGGNPGDVPRGIDLTMQPHLPEVPAGLPAFLLERRPDIRASEAQLMGRNALIGVARAAYFPAISLTGIGGFQSIALQGLFGGSSGMWTFGGALAQPLFTASSLKRNVQLTEEQQQEAVLNYQQTIQHAFSEVSDALIAYSKDQEFRKQEELLTNSAEDANRLSDVRYRGGAASYLEVLDSNTRYFAAELTLAQAQLRELLDYVELYRALGGGWQQ
jgi:multidrug efflux system outer membrane protein